MQSFELWHPVPRIPEFLAGAVVLQAGNELLVVCDGEFDGGKCLILSFCGVEAFRVHEEFSHSWEPEVFYEPPPKSSRSRLNFPFLKIVNSNWAANSNRARFFREVPTHYFIFSLGHFVDVLSTSEPNVRWADPAATDSLFDSALRLGTTKANMT